MARTCRKERLGDATHAPGRYVPGGRGWIKTKNREYWRYEMEREGALKSRARIFI